MLHQAGDKLTKDITRYITRHSSNPDFLLNIKELVELLRDVRNAVVMREDLKVALGEKYKNNLELIQTAIGTLCVIQAKDLYAFPAQPPINFLKQCRLELMKLLPQHEDELTVDAGASAKARKGA